MLQRQATTAQPSQAAKTSAPTAAPVLADLRRLPVWSLGVDSAPQPSLTALPVQRKLMVGRPDDPSEQEADRVAEQVTSSRSGAEGTRMPDAAIQTVVVRALSPSLRLQRNEAREANEAERREFEEMQAQFFALVGEQMRESILGRAGFVEGPVGRHAQPTTAEEALRVVGLWGVTLDLLVRNLPQLSQSLAGQVRGRHASDTLAARQQALIDALTPDGRRTYQRVLARVRAEPFWRRHLETTSIFIFPDLRGENLYRGYHQEGTETDPQGRTRPAHIIHVSANALEAGNVEAVAATLVHELSHTLDVGAVIGRSLRPFLLQLAELLADHPDIQALRLGAADATAARTTHVSRIGQILREFTGYGEQEIFAHLQQLTHQPAVVEEGEQLRSTDYIRLRVELYLRRLRHIGIAPRTLNGILDALARRTTMLYDRRIAAAPAGSRLRQTLATNKDLALLILQLARSEVGETEEPAGAAGTVRRQEQFDPHAPPDADRPDNAAAPTVVHQVLKSPGQPLDAGVRAFMEPRFGRDFSGVRVHTDAQASQSAQAVQARAYAVGHDLVFKAGQYAPHSAEGRKLIAHELAHVVQQGNDTRPARRSDVVQRAPDDGGSSAEPPVATLSVSLSGMTFVPQGQTYRAGHTRGQAMAIILRRLVGPQYRQDLPEEVLAELGRQGIVGINDLDPSRTVRADTPIRGLFISVVYANALISTLETTFGVSVALSDHQRELLALGLATKEAYQELEPDLPAWYSEYIFAREMAQHAPLLRTYREAARTASTGGAADARRQALANILQAISPAAELLETIRLDYLIAHESPQEGDDIIARRNRTDAVVGYCSLWGVDIRQAANLGGPPPPTAIRQDFAVLVLAFIRTQPQLMEQAAVADGHDARVALLARFTRFSLRVVRGTTGDEALLTRPARANAPAWEARLTSHPPLQPPLYDAALETDHRFTMSLQFAHWTDAFAMYVYLWERIRVPDQPQSAAQPPDLAQMAGERPTLGEVYDVRMRRARRYNATDIQRIQERTGVPFGIGTRDLVEANNALRIVGTVVRLGLERITMPRHDTQVVFPAPGLYVIRCRAVPILEGDEELVRAPSIAYQPVVARDPTEMAITQVQQVAQQEFQARLRLAEIQAMLDSPFPPPNRAELLQEMEILRTMTAEPAAALTRRRDELQNQVNQVEQRMAIRRQIRELESEAQGAGNAEQLARLRRQLITLGGPGNDWDDERLLRALRRQLTTANEMIATREARIQGETGLRETMPATFVSDLGHSIALALEVYDRGPVNGQREVYISDLTTPESGHGLGRAGGRDVEGREAKIAAVRAALQDLLENGSDYGRGQVAFRVEGTIHSLRVEAGTGRLLSEAVESGVMVVSIAAIAAAPFTSGASLYLLLPLGIVGAIPSAYRLYSRYDAHTLRFDLNAAMDVVNIVGGMLGLAHAATPLRMVRMGRFLMIMGIGADGAGILLMGAGIVQQIDALQGLPEGERAARMLEIIGNAMVQMGIQAGGMIAHARYQAHAEAGQPRGASDDAPGFHPPREGQVPAEAGGSGERTMAGTGRPPAAPPPAAAPPTRRPSHPANSPERLLEHLAQGVDRSLPPPRPAAEVPTPPRSGTYRRGNFSAGEAYRLYNQALEVSAGREVAVYHNQQTGEFAIRIGSEASVGAPPGELGWHAVVHYHPNQANVLTYRLPAPADFNGLIMRYAVEGRLVREFVEFDIPGVGRGRTEFGIDPANPEPFYVRINMPDGTSRTVRFANDGAYHAYWGERTRYVEPGSPEYRQMIDDISRFLRDRESTLASARTPQSGAVPGSPAGERTMAGARRGQRQGPLQTGDGSLTAEGIAHIRQRYNRVVDPGPPRRLLPVAELSDAQVQEFFRRGWSWAVHNQRTGRTSYHNALEDIVVAEVRLDWLGRTTRTDFVMANPRQTLRDVATRLQRAVTEGNTGHTIHDAILDWSVMDFVREMVAQRDPTLEPAYRACQNHPDPALRRRWREFLLSQGEGDLSGFFLGRVGDKRPDIVEVMLGQGEIHLYDASFAYQDPIHNFKSAFYRTVMERLINVGTVTATDYRSPLRQTPIGP